MDAFKQQSLILGCMRLNKLSEKEVDKYLKHVIENGVTFFDHSDIYGGGECEKVFGKFLKNNPGLRDKIIIQDKNDIVPNKGYDASYQHIMDAVEQQLKVLNTDHLDILMLHRPDPLLETEEVNKAFNELKQSGKVFNFGVSNFPAMFLEVLQRGIDEKIKFNQIQFGPAKADLVADSLMTNILQKGEVNRYSETLEYLRLNKIRMQAWSPLQYGFIEGCFFTNPKYGKLNEKLSEIGEKHGVDKSAIAIAFNLRLPNNMQVILGTMNEKHFDAMIKARDIKLDRQEWYDIFASAGYPLP